MLPEKKNRIVGISLAFLFGTVFLVVGSGVLFGLYKPFEDWVYHECFYRNLDYFHIDRNHERFIYVVEGIRYEKTVFMANRGYGVCFWYNAKNPEEVIFLKDFFMVLLPILIVAGVALIIIGSVKVFKYKKKYGGREFYNYEEN